MPIFDQGYQHWEGKLSPFNLRWLAVTMRGVKLQFRSKWPRMTILAAWIPGLILVLFLCFWGLVEQKSTLIQPYLGILRFFGIPENVESEAVAYRVAIWTIAFDIYLYYVVIFLSMILIVQIGPDLISQDLRFNAIPLYLSRPLRRIDYFVGKLGIIAVFIGLVTVVPIVLAYVLGLLFSFDLSVVKDTFRIFVASLAYGVIIILSCGLLMLAISSISRNSRYVGAIWIGLWFISSMVSSIMTQALPRQKWTPLVSYTENIGRVGKAMLGTEAAYTKMYDAYAALMEAGDRASQLARRRQHGLFAPPRREVVEIEGNRTRITRTRKPLTDSEKQKEFGWEWSAGILLALLGLSVCILSLRVRTLDRLR